MWLVPRDTNGLGARRDIPGSVREALVRWYTGKGSDADHRASATLVTIARENEQWIACSCLGETRPPPLTSPAYLSEAETYYLRRLTSRPLHLRRCPFYLPPAPDRIRERPGDSLFEIEFPKGLFNAHKKAPEKLAQQPDDSHGHCQRVDRDGADSVPRARASGAGTGQTAAITSDADPWAGY